MEYSSTCCDPVATRITRRVGSRAAAGRQLPTELPCANGPATRVRVADLKRTGFAPEREFEVYFTHLAADLTMVFLPGIDRVSHRLWGSIEPPERYAEPLDMSALPRATRCTHTPSTAMP